MKTLMGKPIVIKDGKIITQKIIPEERPEEKQEIVEKPIQESLEEEKTKVSIESSIIDEALRRMGL